MVESTYTAQHQQTLSHSLAPCCTFLHDFSPPCSCRPSDSLLVCSWMVHPEGLSMHPMASGCGTLTGIKPAELPLESHHACSFRALYSRTAMQVAARWTCYCMFPREPHTPISPPCTPLMPCATELLLQPKQRFLFPAPVCVVSH